MTDPWADVRDSLDHWGVADEHEARPLLADADALLAVVRAGVAYKETLAKFGREPEGIYHVGDELLLDDWTDAIATLPKHLRGVINERSRKA